MGKRPRSEGEEPHHLRRRPPRHRGRLHLIVYDYKLGCTVYKLDVDDGFRAGRDDRDMDARAEELPAGSPRGDPAGVSGRPAVGRLRVHGQQDLRSLPWSRRHGVRQRGVDGGHMLSSALPEARAPGRRPQHLRP
jgi:hypothetical protein